jgi:hypothetical protein
MRRHREGPRAMSCADRFDDGPLLYCACLIPGAGADLGEDAGPHIASSGHIAAASHSARSRGLAARRARRQTSEEPSGSAGQDRPGRRKNESLQRTYEPLLVRKFTDLRPQTCRPQLCTPGDPLPGDKSQDEQRTPARDPGHSPTPPPCAPLKQQRVIAPADRLTQLAPPRTWAWPASAVSRTRRSPT